MFKEIAEKAIEEQGQISRHAISEMRRLTEHVVDAQRPGAKRLVTPVGRSCKTLTFGNQTNPLPIDKAMKDAISEDGDLEALDEQLYTVLFTELDRRNNTGKLSIKGDAQPSRRYSAVITDPTFKEKGNIYAESLSAEKWIVVRGKMLLKDGDPYRLYVSNGNEDQN